MIASYLADKYRDEGASFDLPTPELRAHDQLVQRIHDQYIAPIQVMQTTDVGRNYQQEHAGQCTVLEPPS